MQPQGSPVRRSTAHGCRASQATRPSCGTGFSGSIICFLCLSPLPLYTLHLHSSPFVFSAADLVPVSSAVTSCPAVSAGLEERLCGTPAAPPPAPGGALTIADLPHVLAVLDAVDHLQEDLLLLLHSRGRFPKSLHPAECGGQDSYWREAASSSSLHCSVQLRCNDD